MSGVYTDPGRVVQYTSNNECRQEFTVIFHAGAVAGRLTTSSESRRVQWVPVSEVRDLPMDPSQRTRILWAIEHPGEVYFDSPRGPRRTCGGRRPGPTRGGQTHVKAVLEVDEQRSPVEHDGPVARVVARRLLDERVHRARIASEHHVREDAYFGDIFTKSFQRGGDLSRRLARDGVVADDHGTHGGVVGRGVVRGVGGGHVGTCSFVVGAGCDAHPLGSWRG